MKSGTELTDKIKSFPVVTVTLALFACVIYLLPGWPELMQFDREAPNELWRFFTAHFAHYSFEHLFWDVLIFLILGIVCELRDRKEFVICVAVSAVLISFSVLFFLPLIANCRGASGIDSALVIFLAVSILIEERHGRDFKLRAAMVMVIVGLIVRIIYEYYSGSTILVHFKEANMVPVPLVHLVGAITGAVLALKKDLYNHLFYRLN